MLQVLQAEDEIRKGFRRVTRNLLKLALAIHALPLSIVDYNFRRLRIFGSQSRQTNKAVAFNKARFAERLMLV